MKGVTIGVHLDQRLNTTTDHPLSPGQAQQNNRAMSPLTKKLSVYVISKYLPELSGHQGHRKGLAACVWPFTARFSIYPECHAAAVFVPMP
jgi:hypothetical protein